ANAPIPNAAAIEGIDIWQGIAEGKPLPERTLYWRTPRQLAIRKGDWKLIHQGKEPGEGKDELFNLAEDAVEDDNLAGVNISKLRELKRELAGQVAMD
ncbi:hypothetical protein JXJ21_03530, partial [candidate division KSB1 bacterium]|nr:hypothetical protein [candidate division KSB1 bacterium]